jgi:hypothetical protein
MVLAVKKREREVPQAREELLKSGEWLGLNVDPVRYLMGKISASVGSTDEATTLCFTKKRRAGGLNGRWRTTPRDFSAVKIAKSESPENRLVTFAKKETRSGSDSEITAATRTDVGAR